MDVLSLIGLLILLYYFVYVFCAFVLDSDLALAIKEKFGEPISSLKGKKVWIVGASSGIGEELAYVLAETGCKLILSARRTAELERVKKNCLEINNNLHDDDVEAYPLDLLNFDFHKEAFQHVINKFGELDILVNNAGRSQRAQWENIKLEVDKDMFNLDVFSILSLSRLAVKHFLQTGKGHIVVTSSIAGIQAIPSSASYCGAKHALHGYFNALLTEHSDKNIKVTIACPGPVQTNFLAECFTDTPGQKYGVETAVDRSKISARRCAVLMSVAIANKMKEVWIANTPTMRLLYGFYCFPNVMRWLMTNIGPKYLMKVREGRKIE
ncbi:dehydrogenase/reductase SDR family member 7 [Odontomachus brunneus]|uniref:dehydrogenase/reductase SDR family member 7 n=1 Tax=Odontomachus brunneus TaxID=486640 RepID=UPI0013F1DF83|nr:dehydrogenase/reductase SDR family member 7 [Odontomachus brunneus]XP_032678249.1 dehydrogenase/reductase SDR family member 7 [Odontomachus brunneus]XP_032678250.1 dehydrogenase/reductase SDR family member 7 [Odontomachus brunneus]XP_032678251.1 dehydrogenase/reductase SDR family member 7 [Odontomachus brunneus]XP_032678252.1 dehydrogenase/reductase SDR family member 7 [Odontomachus brunneus]XP_032678253.1 dehydrogenase/reductase SDR family member 7 [Odontomachus brunneus]